MVLGQGSQGVAKGAEAWGRSVIGTARSLNRRDRDHARGEAPPKVGIDVLVARRAHCDSSGCTTLVARLHTKQPQQRNLVSGA